MLMSRRCRDAAMLLLRYDAARVDCLTLMPPTDATLRHYVMSLLSPTCRYAPLLIYAARHTPCRLMIEAPSVTAAATPIDDARELPLRRRALPRHATPACQRRRRTLPRFACRLPPYASCCYYVVADDLLLRHAMPLLHSPLLPIAGDCRHDTIIVVTPFF